MVRWRLDPHTSFGYRTNLPYLCRSKKAGKGRGINESRPGDGLKGRKSLNSNIASSIFSKCRWSSIHFGFYLLFSCLTLLLNLFSKFTVFLFFTLILQKDRIKTLLLLLPPLHTAKLYSRIILFLICYINTVQVVLKKLKNIIKAQKMLNILRRYIWIVTLNKWKFFHSSTRQTNRAFQRMFN